MKQITVMDSETGEHETRNMTAEELAHDSALNETIAYEMGGVNHNNIILAKIAEIDKRKIRALTDALLTGDSSRIEELEQQAATLRNQLTQ